MLTIVTCIVASCEKCGDNSDLDGTNVHFANEAEALQWLAEWDWRVLAGGKLLCPTCAAESDCDVYGHQWDWRGCFCAGMAGHHTAISDGVCGHAFRTCERCSRVEDYTQLRTDERPAVTR